MVARALDWVIVTDPQYGIDRTGTADSGAAFQALLNDGRTLYLPPLTVIRSDRQLTNTIANRAIRGPGSGAFPSTASARIVAGAAIDGALFRNTGNRLYIHGVGFDGSMLAKTAFRNEGHESRIEWCGAQGGTEYGLYNVGERSNFRENSWQGENGGIAGGYLGGSDVQVLGDRYRGQGAQYGCIWNASGSTAVQVHFTTTSSLAGLWIRGSASQFHGCYYDTNQSGPLIKIGHTSQCINNQITGGFAHNDSLAAPGAQPAILIDGTSAAVKGTKIDGVVIEGDSVNQLSFLVQQVGTVYGLSFCNNVGKHAQTMWDTRPTVAENNVLARDASANTYLPQRRAGRATFSGNGTQTLFQITGMSLPRTIGVADERCCMVVPGSQDARGLYSVDYDSSGRINIRFVTAPPAGTANLVFNYMVEM